MQILVVHHIAFIPTVNCFRVYMNHASDSLFKRSQVWLIGTQPMLRNHLHINQTN